MKKVYIQVQATEEERRKLAEIAKSRDLDMSKLVRGWIRNAYRQLDQRSE